MDKIDINELIKNAASALDLSNFKGDVVMYKHVEKEMNIAEGGIGEQHIHYGSDVGKTDADSSKPNIGATTSIDDVTNRDTILPADCVAAIGKVLVPTYTMNSVVMNSMQQLIKASAQIDLTSNSEVAMLMAVGQEVNAVRPGVSCPDFVRALIGMGAIPYADKVVETMAGGMTKKLNGYKKGDKEYSPLPANHLRWNSNDLAIGKRLFDAMTKQG